MADPSGIPRAWPTACQNCGATLAGRFCADCGQRSIPPRPTIGDLVGDAWDELVGWDGKLLRTVRSLVLRPGELTLAAIEGRRVRYISPVRLFLVCSVLYFLASASGPLPEAPLTFGFSVGVGVSEPTPGDVVLEGAMRQGLDNLTPEERATVEAEIASQPPIFRPVLRNLVRDYGGFRRRIGEILPRTLFVLVPVFAVVLGFFYRRRHYPEHLYVALHLQSFVFLALTLVALAEWTQSLPISAVATAVAEAIIVVYAIVALHRVYGGSWGKAIAKAVSIAVIYGALWGTASLGAAIWVSRA